MITTVFGLAMNDEHAAQIVRRLEAAGVPTAHISLLFSNPGEQVTLVNSSEAPEGAAGGAAGGALVGGALGWFAGIGAIAVPGLGPLVAAGPILATLSGVAAGGMLGGITGALMGLGAPEYEATRYERRVLDGSVLLSVHADSEEVANRIIEILRAEQAESISKAVESVSADY